MLAACRANKVKLSIGYRLQFEPHFNELKRLMKTTDGNLSVHARKLEEAHYVQCTKSFDGRVPRTQYRLTDTGRRALERYLDHMEALIRTMRER